MRKIFTSSIITVVLLLIATPVFAVKPDGVGAQFIDWNLSGEVMPVPPCGPYGTMDLPGSDTESKLIVNQPNGNTEVAITGAMNGLSPTTTYTVYLTKEYIPYTGWNVGNVSEIAITWKGTDVLHITNIVQTGTSITGGTIVHGAYPKGITSGSVIGNNIEIWAVYTSGGEGTLHLTGTIACDGSMSGNWTDTWPDESGPVLRNGPWRNTIGVAIGTGNTGWPGLFTSTIPAFTFVTDVDGAGSWHINLRDADFPGPGSYKLSVWINGGGRTILISDTFEVTVD